MIELPDDFKVREVRFQPIIRAFAQKIGIFEEFNRQLGGEAEVESGAWAMLMILDTLSGRSPLYLLEDFAGKIDRELLLGKDYDPSQFNDDAAGRFLDRIYEEGSMKLFTSCAIRACQNFELNMDFLRFDTTSRSVMGDYDFPEEEELPFRPAHGHSKDKRPDLKQIVITTLCVDRGIPLLGSFENGNARDQKLNNALLTDLAKDLSEVKEQLEKAVYVADSALVSEENLLALKTMSFLTRLPANYSEHERVIGVAVEKDEWEEVGILAEGEGSSKRPPASYRVQDGEATLYEENYRVVVVHSSAHDKRRRKRLERELSASSQKAQQKKKTEEKITYACQADAQEAANRAVKSSFPYHKLSCQVEERPIYKVGRPPKGKDRPIKEMRYGIQISIEKKEDVIATREKEAGCFVLLTNRPKEGEEHRSAKELLIAYKEQHGVEQNYHFLKDPVMVNRLLLKQPRRIEALGTILLLSLLIWRLFERAMRDYIKKEKTTITGLDKKQTTRPTAYMMTTKFMSVLVMSFGGQRQVSGGLNDVQKEYLKALSLPLSVFTDFEAFERGG